MSYTSRRFLKTIPQTLVEKIVQKYQVPTSNTPVQQGDFLVIRPHRVMTHDNTGAVIPKFESIGGNRINDPNQLVFTLDHDVQNTSPTVYEFKIIITVHRIWPNLKEFASLHKQKGL